MPSPVWFSSFRTRSAEDNKINRLKRIMKNMDMARILGKDNILGVCPNMPWEVTLEHAEALGMGSRAYTLLEV